MKARFWMMLCAAALLLGALLPVGVQPVQAQGGEPPKTDPAGTPDCPPEGPCLDKEGGCRFPEEDATPGRDGITPTATGGPDDYGYTWDDGVPFNWVDATLAGTDSGLTGDDQHSGEIEIGFPFPFYENTYQQLYFSTNGLVTFEDYSTAYSNTSLPQPATPNNLIAVLWDDLVVGQPYNPGKIYYLQGGTAPNRYFVIEWVNVTQCCVQGSTEYKTFEVILYENGNIVTQYLSLSGSLTYATVGLEDSSGESGLTYVYNSAGLGNNLAVAFLMPGPTARVKASPPYNGGWAHSNSVSVFNATITNNGSLGDDIYDFNIASAWPVTLYASDGVTPLEDTDGDSLADTGPLAQGASLDIVVQITAPAGLVVGDENTTLISAASSLNPVKTKIMRIESTVPAPFAQVFRDQNAAEMNLDLNWPEAHATFNANPDQSWSWGYEPSVVETVDHNFVYVWTESGQYYEELHYTILDPYGQVIKPAANLTRPDADVLSSYDYGNALAAAPDGRIGITWTHYKQIVVNNQILDNYNIWFAILNPDGTLAYGPANLTGNTAFVPYGNDLLRMVSPTIAASGDNRFMVSWNQYSRPGGSYLYENYYTIRSSTGTLLTPIVKMAEGVPGSLRYRYPRVVSLTGDRFLLAYYYYSANPYTSGIYYRVYNSGGGLLIPETDSGLYGSAEIDAVQLTGGNVLLAVGQYDRISYTILNGSSLLPTGSYAPLSHPSGFGFMMPAVTIDSDNHAILTWRDNQSRYLYYALLAADGSVLGGPSIYRLARSGYNPPYLETSNNGHGLTSNTWVPAAGVDALVGFNSSRYGAKPGGIVAVWLEYANHGVTAAVNPVLTLTIPPGLTHLGTGIGDCSLVDTLLTCTLPDLDFLAAEKFPVYLQIPPGTPIGTTYALNAVVSSDGPEADPTNNTADSIVFAANQIYLPILLTR